MTSRYASMSRDQLIEALEKHDQTLQSIFNTIHLPNTKMAPGEKLFWIGARCILPQEKPNADGLKRMPTDKVATFIGMAESTAGRYSNAVIERYNATKVPVPYTTKKGQDCTLTYVDPHDKVWSAPWEVDLPEEKERTINGNGRQCPRCSTFNLQITTRRIKYQEIQTCDCCGYEKVSPILDDKAPLDPGEYIPQKKGPQPEEPFEEALNLASLPVSTVGVSTELMEPPAWLRSLKIWCCHRAKEPFQSWGRNPQRAKSSDPATWGTYEQAQRMYEDSVLWGWKEPFDGIGLMCDGTFTVIDYDHCIVDGQVTAAAWERAQQIISYMEVSPSGTGIHQIAQGTIPTGRKRPDIEMYCGGPGKGRFLTWTGKHIIGTPPTVEEQQAAITALYEQISPKASPPLADLPRPAGGEFPPCADEEIISKASAAKNGAKFRKLWSGDASDYLRQDGTPDQSSADLALCSLLAYWTDGSVDSIDRLFRKSGLMREKWARDDYREWTLNRALGRSQEDVA